MDDIPEERQPKARYTIQIQAETSAILDKVSKATGLSKAQLVDFLVGELKPRDFTARVKAAGITKRPVGKRKQSIWA